MLFWFLLPALAGYAIYDILTDDEKAEDDAEATGEEDTAMVAEITRSSTSDDLSGTAGPDRIFGMTGTDLLRGLAGDDTLLGGPGSDTLLGGDGMTT